MNRIGVNTEFFFITGKGIKGYLSNYRRLRKTVSSGNYSLIHAHYGLSGLLAVMQRKLPVVVTFHGSDVNNTRIYKFSKIASRLSSFNIVVEKSFVTKLNLKNNHAVLPCGVDTDIFYPTDKQAERKNLSYNEEVIILFSGEFDNKVKNYPLAKEAVQQVAGAKLIELKGFSREQINKLMNAADMLLLTSFSEGSPQVIKEALACNLPVISTPVGDVPSMLHNSTGNFIVNYNVSEVVSAINAIVRTNMRTTSRETVLHKYDNKIVAKKLVTIYESLKLK